MKLKNQQKNSNSTGLIWNFYSFGIVTFLVVASLNAIPQIYWTKYEQNPIVELGPTGSWDSESIEGCSILFFDDLYHMWYAGLDGYNYRIGHAISQDGIIWTKDTLNPVLDIGIGGSWEDILVYMPSVIFNGSEFHMWYAGNDGTVERVGHATSSDGSNWTKDALNPVLEIGEIGSWEDKEVFPMPGSVILDDNNYKMWYGGLSYNTGIYATGLATSTDGSEWTKHLQNPVMEASPSGNFDWFTTVPGSVVFDGEQYQMWYSGSGSDYKYQVGYATSTNGIDWIKETNYNPVLEFGPPGSWDELQAWCASVLFDSIEESYKMWFTGGTFFDGQIGYATSPLTSINKNTLESPVQLEVYPNPSSGSIHLRFTINEQACLPNGQGLTICDLYEISGVKVKQLLNEEKTPGTYELEIDLSGLPNGVYFCVLKTNEGIQTAKMIKL